MFAADLLVGEAQPERQSVSAQAIGEGFCQAEGLGCGYRVAEFCGGTLARSGNDKRFGDLRAGVCRNERVDQPAAGIPQCAFGKQFVIGWQNIWLTNIFGFEILHADSPANSHIQSQSIEPKHLREVQRMVQFKALRFPLLPIPRQRLGKG